MFEYEIIDMLPIDGRCVVFTGKVEQGEVHVGDELLLKSPQGEVGVLVKSLEPSGFRRSGAMTGDNVAIVVDPFPLGAISDGFCLNENRSFQVRSLTLHGQWVNVHSVGNGQEQTCVLNFTVPICAKL